MATGFIDACGTEELAEGELRLIERAGEPILLTRSRGTYHAVAALCPHEDAPMEKGYIKDHCPHCPLHGSYFDLETGEVMADPAEEGIAVYEVEVADGRVLVGPAKG